MNIEKIFLNNQSSVRIEVDLFTIGTSLLEWFICLGSVAKAKYLFRFHFH